MIANLFLLKAEVERVVMMVKIIQGYAPAQATIISVLSAILGGATGGIIGAYGGHPITAMIGGLCFGFLFTIPFNIVLLTVAHMLSLFINSDFNSTPIGCRSNTILSAVLGGAGGMISSPVLVLVAFYIGDIYYALLAACIISVLVPVAIGYGLVRSKLVDNHQ